MDIKVSFIVPVYNVEKYLKDCVDSLLAQTLEEIEIILVDDGSPDSCPDICDEYAQKDERIKVIHKKNGGLAAARNSGMKQASGEY
ncbi:MAG: glycosyltransferase family 2 protein, partial [Clostridia bacterium]|nr:glycosyltransferase family 2 protein [Clostridia bacterium]